MYTMRNTIFRELQTGIRDLERIFMSVCDFAIEFNREEIAPGETKTFPREETEKSIFTDFRE